MLLALLVPPIAAQTSLGEADEATYYCNTMNCTAFQKADRHVGTGA